MSYRKLRDFISDGMGAEEAADTLIAGMMGSEPRPEVVEYAHFTRPFVLAQARHIEGRRLAAQMREQLLPPPVVPRRYRRGGRQGSVATVVRKMKYKMSDGTVVLWDDLTLDMLNLKIAQLKKQLGAVTEHLAILSCAHDLLAESGKTRLGEIPGWEDRVWRRLAGAGTIAVPASPDSARPQAAQ